MSKRKVAVVCQRYGVEVNGGAETFARDLAENLNRIYDVEVLTTCALEYITWENYYPAGTQKVNGLVVHRFEVDKPRVQKEYMVLQEPLRKAKYRSLTMEEEWLDLQGPYSPQCIQYMRDNKDKYEAFIFVTYLYYLTARGMPEVMDKAVLIPTAHDETYIRYEIYHDCFTKPQALLFLTEEERDFVHKLFNNEDVPSLVMGSGIEVPRNVSAQRFRQEYGEKPYLLYVGRIDLNKGCATLFEYFLEYKRRNPSDLRLLLMGKAAMGIPTHSKDIVSLGFVSEQVKYDGIAGAEMTLLPSRFESLSISVLESMALGVPVVVNGYSEVLKGHCDKSNAGLYYLNYEEFEGAVNYLLEHNDVRAEMSNNAKTYVQEHYQWNAVLSKIDTLLENSIWADAKKSPTIKAETK